MTDKRKEMECCRYNADERQLIISRRGEGKNVGSIIAGVLIVALLVAAICLVLAGDKNGLAEKFASFSILNGFLFWNEESDTEGSLFETEPETENETEAVSETDDTTEEFSERVCESEFPSERIESDARENTVSKDLSFMEYGEGYYVNMTDERIVVQQLLDRGFSGGLVPGVETPQVLVIHTHTSEAYWDADPQNESHNVLRGVVAVGELVAAELNLRGVAAVHCTVIHDGDSKRDSYEKMEETVEMMMEIYPSLRYVIDLHRISDCDEQGFAIRTCAPDESAQVRLTVSAEDAPRYDDLTLALCLKRRLNEKDAGACMPIVLTDELRAGGEKDYYFLKVEIGGLGNTSEEAKAAGARLAVALAEVLKQ